MVGLGYRPSQHGPRAYAVLCDTSGHQSGGLGLTLHSMPVVRGKRDAPLSFPNKGKLNNENNVVSFLLSILRVCRRHTRTQRWGDRERSDLNENKTKRSGRNHVITPVTWREGESCK